MSKCFSIDMRPQTHYPVTQSLNMLQVGFSFAMLDLAPKMATTVMQGCQAMVAREGWSKIGYYIYKYI